jgi:methylthioribose-1-phosphate isomerase
VALAARQYTGNDTGELAAFVRQAMAALAESRPTAVNLFWALTRMGKRLDSLEGQGCDHIRNVIRSAHRDGKVSMVWVDETRPVLQGARLTAWEMVKEKIPATLITDNMAGFIMASGEVDFVVVGSDRIAANGDVANKIGTYSVAVLAQRHNIPFVVAAPLSTIDAAAVSGEDIPIEERESGEVTGYGTERWAPPEIRVFNPAFDVTPAELVTAIVTEKGILKPPYGPAIAELLGTG